MAAALVSGWKDRRRRVFQSVFQTDFSQPTPHSTPSLGFPDQGQAFGGPLAAATVAAAATRGGRLDYHDYLQHRDGTAAPSSGPFTPRQQTTPRAGNAGAVQAAQQGRNLFGESIFQQAADQLPSAHSPTPTASFGSQSTIRAPSLPTHAQPLFPSLATAGDDQVAFDRAWHVVTARIALPASATADDSFGSLAPEPQYASQGQSSDADFYEALTLVVQADTLLPRATHTDDILAWHTQQVRSHFAQHVLPMLLACVDHDVDDSAAADKGAAQRNRAKGTRRGGRYHERHMLVVMSSIRTLEAALRLYRYGLELIIRGFHRVDKARASADAHSQVTRFRRDIHALVGNSVSAELMRSLRIVLAHLAGQTLGIPPEDDREQGARPAPPTEDDLWAMAARQQLHELVGQLDDVGLAGERFQVLFAEIMDSVMSDFIRGAYAGVWTESDARLFTFVGDTISRAGNPAAASSFCIASLSDWVENHFARLSFEVLSRIAPDATSPVTLSDVKTYQSLALARLAALRTGELFDIVLAWPSARGALDDLRATITTAPRRLQLTGKFIRALQKRLLHPGCSTLQILRTYIAIIRTFHSLDHSKVLLGHVEPCLQLYLCQRDDAIRLVVTGLLASPEEIRAARKANDAAVKQGRKMEVENDAFTTPAKDPVKAAPSTTTRQGDSSARDVSATKLVELGVLLNDASQTRRTAPEVDEDLDWDDMKWMPDPVDAGANYKRPKSEDVIGTLISALGSEDVFIKEFASIVAERLLGEPARHDQELRVLDLLKRRFGEGALQDCDVMIRDVQDSRRVDAAIRTMRQLQQFQQRQPRGGVGDGPQYHARVLSRLFWPNLDREHFLLPQPVVDQQKWYEKGYESLKSNRKLTWLNQLGQARVELELEDRTVTADCTTAEATVIYAFQEDGEEAVTKTVDELYMQLQMDEDMIAAALSFWVSKGVLRKQGEVYTVIETLQEEEATTAAAAAAAAATAPEQNTADKGDESAGSPLRPAANKKPAKEREKEAMYWQYIRGMLTNASATMPLGQMAMMMKMLIPEGFPWSNEELQDFLAEKVKEGLMEIVGGKYKLKK
ncbi:anaphase-promoting complex subunit 2 [Diplogelasinospora grovesii]|uniref:Anaphase-promoting complex subunit 2 n=1 Tax=Diplogelasinospora grovesii TaxID=303347 RepID=A0AAN6S3Y6_9PEZI|nr:anaphase-promoting complex subunit 2 [Diplogelasinospora grovesii]